MQYDFFYNKSFNVIGSTRENQEIKREEEFNNYELELQGLRDVHKFPAPSCPAWLDRIPAVNIPPLQGVNLDYVSAYCYR